MEAPLPHSRPAVGGPFWLIDHNGRAVSAATFYGGDVLFFFGFTNSKGPGVRALANLARALERIGRLADRIQPLYVTVDPERDTPKVMREFLVRYYPRFLGVTGSRAQIDAIKSAFRVHSYRHDEPDGSYQVLHTTLTYVSGPDGRYVDHWPAFLDEDLIAERLTEILARGSRSEVGRVAVGRAISPTQERHTG